MTKLLLILAFNQKKIFIIILIIAGMTNAVVKRLYLSLFNILRK